jgi:hypothetical protein
MTATESRLPAAWCLVTGGPAAIGLAVTLRWRWTTGRTLVLDGKATA